MKRSILFLSLLSAFALSAHATPPGNNGGGNGGCGVGQQTNGCGGQAGGNGGNGGNGGHGGAGGSSASNASAQANAAAIALAAQRQAQRQSQRQTQTTTVSPTITNTLSNGPTTVTVVMPASDGAKTAATEQPLKEAAVAEKAVVVPEVIRDTRPVSQAYAAPLTATNGTCMGSTSGGVQVASVGLSGGSTWTDSNCDIRYDAEALRAAGLAKAAIARLCQKGDIAKAMEAAGTACPGTDAARAESLLNGEPAKRQVTASAALDLLP